MPKPSERLRRRAMTVVAALSEEPDASLPEIAATPAALKAMYRLVNHKRVTWRHTRQEPV